MREAAYQALKVNGWLFHKVTDYGGIEIVQTTHDGIILATCHHRRWLEIEGGKRLGWGQVREELDFGNRFREVEEPFFSVVKHDCKCGYKGFNL